MNAESDEEIRKLIVRYNIKAGKKVKQYVIATIC